MARLKQIITILLSLIILIILLWPKSSTAANEENLNLETLWNWMQQGSDEFLNLDASKLLQLYGRNGEKRLAYNDGEYDETVSSCMNHDFVDKKWYVFPLFEVIDAIIDVDSDGTVTRYTAGGSEQITGDAQVRFMELACLAELQRERRRRLC